MAQLLISVALAGSLTGAPLAAAQAQGAGSNAESLQTVNFSIPSQPLSQALNAFAKASGWQVAYSPDATRGVRSNPVTGPLAPDQALRQLLAGTGVVANITGPRSAAIITGAQSGAIQADPDTVLLETVIVASGEGEKYDKYSAAGSTEYISADQIELFRGTSPGDFLKGTAGVLVGESRNGGAIDVNIRGMQGQGRVPVIIDGSYQETTTYRGYYGITGKTFLDPDLIGSVEIEKGPSAGADGVGAVGGVVRMSTLNPADIITEGKNYGVRLKAGVVGNSTSAPGFPKSTAGKGFMVEEDAITLGASAGGADQYDRPGLLEFFTGDDFAGSASVAGAYQVGGLEVLAAFARRSVGNYYAGTNGGQPTEDYEYRRGQEVLNTSNDSKSYLLKGILSFGDGHSVKLGYTRYESTYGEVMPSTMAGVLSIGTLQHDLGYTAVDTATARYEWQPEDSSLINLTADFFYTNLYQDMKTAYTTYAFPGYVAAVPVAYINRTEQWGANVSNISSFTTPIGDLELEYGGMYRKEMTYPAPEHYELIDSGQGVEAWSVRDGWREEYSGFATVEYLPHDKVTLLGSLRYTHSKSFDNVLLYNLDENNSEENSGWAPIVSAKYEVFPGVQVYAKYAEAIRMPSLYEATSGWSASNRPETELKPEHSRTYEVGANVHVQGFLSDTDNLGMKLSLFDSTVDDYISRDTSGGSLVNIRKAYLKGVEMSFDYDSRYVFASASATRYLDTNFCKLDGECFQSGTRYGYSSLHLPPEFSANITAGVKLFDEKLRLGARMSHIGYRAATETGLFGGAVTARVDWEPYTVFDLFGSYDVNDHLQIDFAVDNVTDEYYMDALSVSPIASPGRTARLNLTAKF
ncbi:TonB-dependent receptor [Roseibium aggregatum]|uniref:TonB-dependent receptor n=1 Tax=Roseibium aggregatum TaxID=187304 RepID=A0A939J5N4_9HYPH|nr:TonB-dependent receptor [Roseibium aggregatum]MBN9672435.1 TonB-dependent receptor [Roseibium aggregatum]